MKLAVFGCSCSYGTSQSSDINKRQPNWVTSLSKLRPDINITNFSYATTSLQFSASLFDRYASEFDYTIFQITGSGRLCYWPDNFDFQKHLVKFDENLLQFNDLDPYIFATTVSTINDPEKKGYVFKSRTQDEIDFAYKYYKYMPIDLIEIEYKSIINEIYDRANLTFWHYGIEQFRNDILSIHRELGDKQFHNYSTNSFHFNQDGCDWQAKYINDKYL